MNKIIKGKKYNTETAKELASVDSGHPRNDFNFWEETLYRTKSGHFFLYGYGGGNSRYGEWHGNSGGSGGKIMTMEPEESREWAERNLSGEEVERIFGAIEEGKVKITADISKTAKDKIDKIKDETRKSTGEIIEDLLK